MRAPHGIGSSTFGRVSPFEVIPEREWIAANEVAFAVRDRYPVSPGHALVISRRVVPTWWDATDDERIGLMDLVGDVKLRLDAEHAPAGYNVGFNAGAAAGQTVPHLHVHVIPRYVDDVDDPRGGVRRVIPGLGNYLDPGERTLAPPRLVTPADQLLRSKLVSALNDPAFDRIDLVVSFVMRSGVNLVASHIDAALARGAQVRLLTTDYLAITDPAALAFFLDRVGEHPNGGRMQVRVFSDPKVSFHPKGYLFWSTTSARSVAIVGSSNMSRSALMTGVEWNVETERVGPFVVEFESIWSDPRATLPSAEWLDHYRASREAARVARSLPALPPGDESRAVAPWSVQREALTALEAARIDGQTAGMVVMATGLGKTWLAAFDATRPTFGRVLFVAHRDEILTQARDVFRLVRPGGTFTFFTGTARDSLGDVVFASVQSLSKHLAEFARDHFDYVVVDEFHHAAAPTYRRVIGHFRPKFLLGLTATPDRSDAADLLVLCDDNLIYECGLPTGVARGLLSPFAYRAIRDVADYAEIPWRNGRFDPEVLSQSLETIQRADQVLTEWQALGGASRRTLGFCCTITHAEFMAAHFRRNGVHAVAVHSGSGSAPRAESLERLETGALPVIFTVDLFNEGVDVPSVDVILMLRPTESRIVFFQQLGRGLRRAENKTRLDVLDLVGNHRSFLMKAQLLALLAGHEGRTAREAVDLLRHDLTELPDGCSIVVDTEAVELMEQLLGAARPVDRLVELIREWTAAHGRRPTALEAATALRRAIEIPGVSTWFEFLDGLDVLDDAERSALTIGREVFRYVERGSYTKSYKLVTLRCLLGRGQLRRGMNISELATYARWEIQSDARLAGDLDDTASAFADPQHPTDEEWQRYWRRNPVRALVGEGRARLDTGTFFRIEADRLLLDIGVPVPHGDTFDRMMDEIVEYRLHRYLMGKAARSGGEKRKLVAADSTPLDATFALESRDGRATAVVLQSAGGTRGSTTARNVDYLAGLDLLLERIVAAGITIEDALVDSSATQTLTIADRRLAPGEKLSYPISPAEVGDIVALRKSLLRSMASVGRDPGAKGGGNQRKALRLIISGVPMPAAQLAHYLSDGSKPSLASHLLAAEVAASP